MLLVDLYQYLILFIAGVGTYQLSQRYRARKFNSKSVNASSPQFGIIVLATFLVLLIGLRPTHPSMIWMWGDSFAYNFYYQNHVGDAFGFNPNTTNFIWDNLFGFWASVDLGLSSLFLLSDAIYFGCTYLACKKWFPHDTAIAYLAFLGAFSTYSYSYNGVKAGIAGAIFLLALAYYKKRMLSVILVVISLGFHHSMQIPIAAYVLYLFFKDPKWYFYGWLFCAMMAILHVSSFAILFASISSDEKGIEYLLGRSDYAYLTGFRLDFLLYSVAPIWVGYVIVIKNRIQVSRTYLCLLCMYLCTNGIWCLCMYASSTNRIAYLSWFMYPFVLIYPFLKENLAGMRMLGTKNQYVMLSMIVMCHFLFTFFMHVIY